ncbi:acyloxyacyl hydrolase [Oceanimonas pelagia]|uniref:Acyloxyacyl hydrolase n=1 Tax=Oceanimonas pelagia TaxID=3028314 RepID=A0AA50KM32_9GAMM|nr:acyloxyacyl hydrolase [Oceanimonas pelagia]WMC09603.1 acyloxyacyl hydrolase [Oceanimonas pelagia]
MLLLIWPAILHGEPAVVVSTGHGDDAERYTLGAQWLREWRQLQGGGLDFALNLDGSYWTLERDGLAQFSLVPGLVYKGSQPGLRPLAYAGVGPAWINQEQLGSRQLSTRLQFNSRAGLGVAMGRHSLALEAWHLSNGGLKKPNDGLTSWGISYRYRFD